VPTVKYVEEPATVDAGWNEQAASVGSPEQEKVRVPEKPAMLEVEIEIPALEPAAALTDGVAVSVKSGLATVTPTTLLLTGSQLASPE
jgi:hypothetical protein